MASVVVTNVEVLTPTARFEDPLKFQITFEVLAPGIKNCLEWKVIYVSDSDKPDLDQELEAVEVGPCPVGKCKFILEAPAPNAKHIPKKDLLDVTVLLLTCSYNTKEFLRVGYYVSNEHPEYKANDEGEVPYVDLQRLAAKDCTRVINTDKPTVTRFNIAWDNEETDVVSLKRQREAEEDSSSQPDAKRQKTSNSDSTDDEGLEDMDTEKTVVDISSSKVTGRIVYIEPAIQIVTDPYLVGDDLKALAVKSSAAFVENIDADNLSQPVVILEILSGGRHYGLPQAWEDVADREMTVSSLRAKRSQGSDGKWSVALSEFSDNAQAAVQKAGTVLIGDTIATGSTLKAVIDWILKTRKEAANGSGEEDDGADIIAFTIAGSDTCLEALEGCGKLCIDAGGSLDLVFANAQFKLAGNGTDLGVEGSYFHPQAETAIRERLGPSMADMKCAVWDWGDRFENSTKHLTEVSAHFKDKKIPSCFSKR